MGRTAHQGNTSDVHTKRGHADASETAFAAMLDRVGIAYEYEPHRLHVGPLTVHGKTKDRALQPDFWIPELDLYVELTTSRTGGMNLDLKLAKVRQLKTNGCEARIAIVWGRELNRMLSLADTLGRADVIGMLERNYRVTTGHASNIMQYLAERAERELVAA